MGLSKKDFLRGMKIIALSISPNMRSKENRY